MESHYQSPPPSVAPSVVVAPNIVPLEEDEFREISVQRVYRLVQPDISKPDSFVVEFELQYSHGRRRLSRWFRYDDLRVVHETLRKVPQWKKLLPDFPGRRFFGLLDETEPEFVEERRAALDTYLRNVLQGPLVDTPEMTAFLASAVPAAPRPVAVAVAPPAVAARPPFAQHTVDETAPFFVPQRMQKFPPVVLLGAEEVWLGVVVDACCEGLRFMNALHKRLRDKNERIDKLLELLEINKAKLLSLADVLKENMPVLSRVISAPGTPDDVQLYLVSLSSAAQAAYEWSLVAETELLGLLCDNDKPTPGAPVSAAVLPSAANSNVAAIIESPRNAGTPYSFPPPIESNVLPSPVVATAPLVAFSPAAPSGSLKDFVQRADELMVQIVSGMEQSQVTKAKRLLLEDLLRKREELLKRDASSSDLSHLNQLIKFVEDNVVFCKSRHDAILRFEAQLYGLIDQRAQLKTDIAEATLVRRGVISLRKILRNVKSEWSKVQPEDAALEADLNRITDLQENATELQLDLEEHFEYQHDLEDMVIDQKRKKALQEAEKDHERAEQDMFGL